MGQDYKVVQRRSENEIEQIAMEVRNGFQIGTKNVRMENLIEVVLREALPGYNFFVLPDEDMPDLAGVTAVGEYTIYLANSVYEALCAGDPEARYVAAHEFGHLLLHSQQQLFLAKRKHDNHHVDPEWQADRFADFWLAPTEGVRTCRSPAHVAAKYAISDEMAKRRFDEVKFHGIQGELF